MAASFEEIVDGSTLLRPPPDGQHERICMRLHAAVAAYLPLNSALRLLPPRTMVEVNMRNALRPDLAIIHAASRRLWLAAEIIDPHDHRVDTVAKKTVYHEVRIPRLWIVDPRYNNVEVYRRGGFGLRLEQILSVDERLSEAHVCGMNLSLGLLFAGS